MIINFHPDVAKSKKGIEIISRINQNNSHKIHNVTEKTSDEWKEIIKGDEELILVSPVNWWGPSYLFDEWAKEVLSYGFAYKYNESGVPEGLLNGRKFQFHLTHGTPHEMSDAMRDNIRRRLEVGIFGFCNSIVDVHFYDMQE